MRTVLVFSADLRLVERIDQLCEPLGYRVRSVANRELLIEWCTLREFDAVVFDAAAFDAAALGSGVTTAQPGSGLVALIEEVAARAPLSVTAIIDPAGSLKDDWAPSLLGARSFTGTRAFDELYGFISNAAALRRDESSRFDTIVLVDDLDSPRAILETYVLALGYPRVVGAASGREALDILHREADRIFCVVADIRMPGMNGIALVQDIRSDPALKAIPVVMLTAEPTADHLLACVRAGATGFLAKPPQKRTLRRELDKAKRIRLFRQSPALLGPNDAARLEAALHRLSGA